MDNDEDLKYAVKFWTWKKYDRMSTGRPISNFKNEILIVKIPVYAVLQYVDLTAICSELCHIILL